MISRVLVPIDDSEMGELALEYALEAFPEADITVLHVVGEPSPMMGEAAGLALSDDIDEAAQTLANEVFDRAHAVAAENDADIATAVEIGQPVRAILNRAAEFDTVVIGSHGGSLADRLFVGNVAEKVVRRSPVPVTVVR
jgi:nucleotide-binding universal stress UspA family protein